MKTLFFIFGSLFAAHTAVAAENQRQVLDCILTEVLDSNYFEESLSTYEYPYLTVYVSDSGKYEVNIGGSLYTTEDGDKISLNNVSDPDSYEYIVDLSIVPASQRRVTFVLRAETTEDKRFAVLVAKSKSGKKEVSNEIANFVCRGDNLGVD